MRDVEIWCATKSDFGYPADSCHKLQAGVMFGVVQGTPVGPRIVRLDFWECVRHSGRFEQCKHFWTLGGVFSIDFLRSFSTHFRIHFLRFRLEAYSPSRGRMASRGSARPDYGDRRYSAASAAYAEHGAAQSRARRQGPTCSQRKRRNNTPNITETP